MCVFIKEAETIVGNFTAVGGRNAEKNLKEKTIQINPNYYCTIQFIS